MQTTATEEKDWLKLLAEGDEQALQLIFNRYYKYLVVTAYNILHDDERAKDMVQEVFFDLWRKRAEVKVQGSLKPYLRRAVVNRAIDVWRSKKRVGTWEEITDHNFEAKETSPQQHLEAADLKRILHIAVESLPDRCRQVFALSRFEDLTHREIAERLDISVKTIENQMTKALRVIRAVLAQHGLKFLVVGVLALLRSFLEG